MVEYEASGLYIRGSGNDFTIYASVTNECIEGGSAFTTFSLTITTGTVDPDTGNLLDVTVFSLTQATAGELSFSCRNLLVGENETVGGWSAAEHSLTRRIE